MSTAVAMYLAVVAVMSLVTYVAYGWDKRRAGRGGRRVSEQALHLMALLGGWPGAWIAGRQFRHKSRKLSFRVVYWLTVVLHVGIVAAAAYAIAAR
jgi:uncharacterized membrane protein YsdA (DUF1294 family)